MRKKKKKETLERVYALFEGRNKVISDFKSGIFSITPTENTGM